MPAPACAQHSGTSWWWTRRRPASAARGSWAPISSSSAGSWRRGAAAWPRADRSWRCRRTSDSRAAAGSAQGDPWALPAELVSSISRTAPVTSPVAGSVRRVSVLGEVADGEDSDVVVGAPGHDPVEQLVAQLVKIDVAQLGQLRGEAREAGVDVDASLLDQAVGVEDDGVSGAERDRKSVV